MKSFFACQKTVRRAFLWPAVFGVIAVAGLAAPSNLRAGSGEDEIKKIELSWEKRLKFGEVASDLTGSGTVIIDAISNSRSVTGAIFDFGGSWSRGKFKIEGEKDAYVNITLPSSVVVESRTGSYTMTLTNLNMNQTNPVKLSEDGKKTVRIGGTLQVAPNQHAGKYRDVGTLIINVDYN